MTVHKQLFILGENIGILFFYMNNKKHLLRGKRKTYCFYMNTMVVSVTSGFCYSVLHLSNFYHLFTLVIGRGQCMPMYLSQEERLAIFQS